MTTISIATRTTRPIHSCPIAFFRPGRKKMGHRPVSASGAPAAPYAAGAVRTCRKLGADVAIATAQLDVMAKSRPQRRFLSALGIRDGDLVYSRTRGSVFEAASKIGSR